MTTGARSQGSASRAITLNLLKNLTLREIRSEYKRTVLGRLWSFINPIAQVAVYGFVFGIIFNAQPPVGINSGIHSYALWLGVGIVTWGFINSGIRDAMTSFLNYQGLLKKVALPRWTLPASKVLAKGITFVSELAVVAILCAIVGGWGILMYIWMLIPLLILTVAFIYGVGLVLAIGIVYFRDLENFWSVLTQIFFYASGVMIPVSAVETVQARINESGLTVLGMPVPLLAVFEANPVYQLLTSYRRVIYDFAFPDPQTLLTLFIWAACVLAIGGFVYLRKQARIVEEL